MEVEQIGGTWLVISKAMLTMTPLKCEIIPSSVTGHDLNPFPMIMNFLVIGVLYLRGTVEADSVRKSRYIY